MEIYNIDDMPDDDGDLRHAVERAKDQVQNLRASLEYNLMTVQMIVEKDDSVNIALVAHNPCDLSQYQVVAFLPTLDNSMATLEVNEAIGQEVAKMEKDMPEDLESGLIELCAKRFSEAGKKDPEVLLRLMLASSFQEARALYQEYYGLTRGGDFNHPLKQ